MNIKFLTFLSLVLLVGATAFGVQNCSKKNDPIVGTWQSERYLAADNSRDLSCANQYGLVTNQKLEFSSDEKITSTIIIGDKIPIVESGKWKKNKNNEYEAEGSIFIIKDGKLHQPIVNKGKNTEHEENITEQIKCATSITAVRVANQLILEYEKR